MVKIKNKVDYIFFELLPFAIFLTENLISQKPLQLRAPRLDS